MPMPRRRRSSNRNALFVFVLTETEIRFECTKQKAFEFNEWKIEKGKSNEKRKKNHSKQNEMYFEMKIGMRKISKPREKVHVKIERIHRKADDLEEL